jgi:hypothetical protein
MTDRESVFEFSPQERGFEPVDDDSETLYRADDSRDATGKVDRVEFAVRTTDQGKFYPQKLELDSDGKIVGKQTIFGRGRRDREDAESAVESFVRDRTAAGFGGFNIGEFNVGTERDTSLARRAHLSRSPQARNSDRGKRAPVTTDAERYASKPGELDYPGLDTPRAEPRTLPKDFQQSQQPDTTEPTRQSQGRRSEEQESAKRDVLTRFTRMTDTDETVAKARATDAPVDTFEIRESQGFGESDVSFAGPTFNRNKGEVVETDRRDREDTSPEQVFDRAGVESGPRSPIVDLSIEDKATPRRNPVTELPGVGPATADELEDEYGVETVEDYYRNERFAREAVSRQFRKKARAVAADAVTNNNGGF